MENLSNSSYIGLLLSLLSRKLYIQNTQTSFNFRIFLAHNYFMNFTFLQRASFFDPGNLRCTYVSSQLAFEIDSVNG